MYIFLCARSSNSTGDSLGSLIRDGFDVTIIMFLFST